MKPMKDPLGVSPSKGNQGTTRGKEKILLTEHLNSGLPRNNPTSGSVEALNLGSPDYNASALNHSVTLPPLTWTNEIIC